MWLPIGPVGSAQPRFPSPEASRDGALSPSHARPGRCRVAFLRWPALSRGVGEGHLIILDASPAVRSTSGPLVPIALRPPKDGIEGLQ